MRSTSDPLGRNRPVSGPPGRTSRHRWAWPVAVAALAAACASPVSPAATQAPSSLAAAGSVGPSGPAAGASSGPSPAAAEFGLGRFPDAPTAPLPAATQAALQRVLDETLDRLPGVAATVLVAGEGTWSGAAGSADGTNALDTGAQFGIASVTKTFVAAEIMRLADEAKLQLDEPVKRYLPETLGLDTRDATIRDLLAMESGIPDPRLVEDPSVEADPDRAWTIDAIVDSIPDARERPGGEFAYSNTSYILLGQVIESVTGTSLTSALRDGVLADPRFERIIYQPDEHPSEPLALPFLGGTVRPDILDEGGGLLPSRAAVTSIASAGAMASDAPSLALWAYETFGGRLLSGGALEAMTDFGTGADADGYGLGVFDMAGVTGAGPDAVGNGGWEAGGYAANLTVLPSRGIVIAVLTNTSIDPVANIAPIAGRLVEALDQ